MKPTFLVSHPTGNTFVRALLEQIQSRNLLHSFHTTLASSTSPGPLSQLVPPLRKHRAYPIPNHKLHLHPLYETFRLAAGRISSHERRRRLADQTYERLDQAVARALPLSPPQIVHAYEDGALHTFRAAESCGSLRSYELPIAHWRTSRRLLAEEAERYPDWEPTLETTREPEEKLHRKDQELRLADLVTCPSSFVLDSIPSAIRNSKPCLLAPFGSPPSDIRNARPVNDSPDSPLKVLFVGSMSQRKGLADLFAAFRLLDEKSFRLTVLGTPSLPLSFYRSEFPPFRHLPPIPRPQVLATMREHHVFALPSIIEGRALVQQEALSCGLPLLVTPNAGGTDLVEEGRTGFLVPIRSPASIAEKLECFQAHRSQLVSMQVACVQKAADYPWMGYANAILDFALQHLPESANMQTA